MTTTIENNNIPIFRFKISENIMNMITDFAKIHQYDDRKDYKDYWNEWIKDNADELQKEERRLQELGYHGDVYDKFFKSGRYYFRKKNISNNNNNSQTENNKRKQYIGVSKNIIENMDNFITNKYLNKNGNNNGNICPANCFDLFCNNNLELLQNEINDLVNNYKLSNDEINFKIKKTFKNRYYRITRNNNNYDNNDNILNNNIEHLEKSFI